jgi:hypothetical protein
VVVDAITLPCAAAAALVHSVEVARVLYLQKKGTGEE